jgi:glucose-like phosphotransferase system IIB component
VPKEGYLSSLLENISDLKVVGMPAYDLYELSPLLDSSNMAVAEWNNIGGKVAALYDKYDGFVILHGTDTMAYTASSLSFMLENLDKPVILTGSQIPLCEVRSDGRDNLITSLLIAASGIVNLRLHSFGNLELATRLPISIKAGLLGDFINFVICVVIFFALGYFVSYYMIGKFRYATPGRLGNYNDSKMAEDTSSKVQTDSQAERIIALLGGRENIILVDACMTRLRVTVNDETKVAPVEEWKKEGALGLIQKGNGIQAVYGPKADVLKSDINDIL